VDRVDLITIARQFGAGGSELARALGDALGWPVLDRDIIHAAAAQLHTDAASTEHLDESVQTTLQTVLQGFAHTVPEVSIEPAYEVDPDELARATHRVLAAAAEKPPLIVVGHGVQCLFANRPGTLHVRVVAPVAVRAGAIASRMNLDDSTARVETEKRDKDRARYLRHHFDCDNSDPILYSVQFNTAQLSVPSVARAIFELVRPTARI
jgi:cytidylate kinase